MFDIVITGIGVISPLGTGRESFWESCRLGNTGIKRITSFDTDGFRSNIGGEVDDFDPSQFMSPRTYRRMSRISRMAVASSIEALDDSGLDLENQDKERVAVLMGTSYGSSTHVEDFYVSLLKDGPRGAQPFLFPETVPNAPASHIAMIHGITGPNSTFCQNEISAENAFLYGANLLSQNIVDIVLVGGSEELSAMLYACYDAVGALNKIRVENDAAIRPEVGGGLILGEGAAVLVMERNDFARARGAKIYGALKAGVQSGGATSIGHYEVNGEQVGRTITQAMKDAGVPSEKVDQVHVSANFSKELDLIEFNQLKRIFSDQMGDLRVTPLKYLTGDFGGAGALRASAILMSLYNKLPLPAVKVDVLKGEFRDVKWEIPQECMCEVALMTTTTFGGGSVSLVFSKST